jgi:hypothetical protein
MLASGGWRGGYTRPCDCSRSWCYGFGFAFGSPAASTFRRAARRLWLQTTRTSSTPSSSGWPPAVTSATWPRWSFKGPLGWLFLRLGAFPVRRGEADAEALETARAILAAGGLVVVFPEGTRVEQPDALGSPHHGAGRLALESEAPIIPAAITGTSHLWRGAIPRLKRVQLAFLPPVAPEQPLDGHEPVSQLIDERVWPAVQEEYGHLRATPGLIAAGLAAIGIGGGLLAKRQLDTRRKPRLLGEVEPRNVRRRNKRRRLVRRLRSVWRRAA